MTGMTTPAAVITDIAAYAQAVEDAEGISLLSLLTAGDLRIAAAS